MEVQNRHLIRTLSLSASVRLDAEPAPHLAPVSRVVTEAAQNYGHPAKVGRQLLKRQEGLGHEIVNIAWKCQVRLCDRFRQLMVMGKHRNKVVIATARELAGFIRAIAQEVPVPDEHSA